ncbi:MAG: hypothetical protein JNN07_04000 [Verrucomicrobiales bacterium]|nr:hypothetical protein [Verrucomicrobiales bacterium]
MQVRGRTFKELLRQYCLPTLAAILGFAAGCSVMALKRGGPPDIDRVDNNHDGVADEIYQYRDGLIWRAMIDRGFTQVFDMRQHHTNGVVHLIELDNNADRNIDTSQYYTNGRLAMMEQDLDFNGQADAKTYYERELQSVVVIAPNGAQVPSVVKLFKNGVLARRGQVSQPGNLLVTNWTDVDPFE